MCFSNLPIEFDEHGDPYLAEEAETVDRPSEEAHGHGDAIDSRENEAEGSDPDPEAMYATIMNSLPQNACQRIAETVEAKSSEGDAHGAESASGG